MIEFYVPGKPVPQGSKRWLPGGRMIEANSDLRPWRATVTAYAMQAMQTEGASMIETGGAASVHATFYFARPKSHYGTGKNAGKVKPNAPMYVTSTPDSDKLLRSLSDSLTDAGVWHDDSQAVRMTAIKLYAEQPGMVVRVWRVHNVQ